MPGCIVDLERLMFLEATQHLTIGKILVVPRGGQVPMEGRAPRTPSTAGGRAEDLECFEGLQNLEDIKHLEA